MIRFGEEEAHLKTVVVRGGREYQIDMHLKKNRAKGIAIDKIPIKKASELDVYKRQSLINYLIFDLVMGCPQLDDGFCDCVIDCLC